MNGKELLDRLRAHTKAAPDAPLGIVASFGKNVTIEGDGRTLQMVATTNEIDCVDEVVVPGGADRSYFEKNGMVFVDHWYDVNSVAGALRSVTPFSNLSTGLSGYTVRVRVLPNEIGNTVLTIANEAGIGCSIGFIAQNYGPPTAEERKRYGDRVKSVVRAWEWRELSFTAMPCNVSCRTMTTTEDDSRKSLIESLIVKGKISREGAYKLGFREAKKKSVIRVMI